MINSICYALIYLFEVLSCFMFFENFYNRKIKGYTCITFYFVSFLIQYGLSFFHIPILNLATFVLCYFIISLFCYESKLKSCIFTSLMLAVFMLITETIVVHVSTSILKVDFTLYQDNLLALVVQSSLSKLFFFVTLLIISKLFRLKAKKMKSNKFAVLLGFLPLTTVIILSFIATFGLSSDNKTPFNSFLAVSSILLLFSNIIVFYIYETVQKTNFEITQLQLEKQREEISKEYYDIMSKDLTNSRILVHDIKKHFESLLLISQKNKNTEAVNYINSISESFGLDTRTKHTGNILIDVIINRYMNTCKAKGIELEIEFCGSRLEFMTDSDIVALLDNMFDNAIEAAAVSEEKDILFSMYVRNDNFVVIKTLNSCDIKPKSKNGKLVSTKNDKLSHGIGTQSIKKVVEKYNGSFSWKYHEDKHQFEATAIVMINQDC